MLNNYKPSFINTVSVQNILEKISIRCMDRPRTIKTKYSKFKNISTDIPPKDLDYLHILTEEAINGVLNKPQHERRKQQSLLAMFKRISKKGCLRSGRVRDPRQHVLSLIETQKVGDL